MKIRWMRMMTFFVIALYSFFFVTGLLAPKEPKVALEKAQALEMLRGKEEIVKQHLNENPQLLGMLSLIFMAVVGLGLALDIYLVSRRLRGRSWPVQSLPPREAVWGVRDVFHSLIFLLFAEAFIFFSQSLLWRLLGYEGPMSDSMLVVSSLVRDLLVAGFVWALVRTKYQGTAADLGLRFQKTAAHIRTGLAGYAAMLPPLLLTFALLAAVLKFFTLEPEPQSVVQIYLKQTTEPFLIPLTLFVAIAGPVMEEVFFRGFVYKGLRGRFGVWGGACLASAVFASLHMNWAAFAPIFVLSLFLTAMYEISGSLVPSITAHVVHNTIMVGLTLGFKGLSS